MKNKINLMILAVLLFFFPLSAEEGSAEKESRIQEVKEKIAEDKEKLHKEMKLREDQKIILAQTVGYPGK